MKAFYIILIISTVAMHAISQAADVLGVNCKQDIAALAGKMWGIGVSRFNVSKEYYFCRWLNGYRFYEVTEPRGNRRILVAGRCDYVAVNDIESVNRFLRMSDRLLVREELRWIIGHAFFGGRYVELDLDYEVRKMVRNNGVDYGVHTDSFVMRCVVDRDTYACLSWDGSVWLISYEYNRTDKQVTGFSATELRPKNTFNYDELTSGCGSVGPVQDLEEISN